MIRFIAAIDEKRGMANEHGIPWQGQIPGDVKNFHDKINGIVLMGFGTYKEYDNPLPGVRNVVANDKKVALRDGFELTTDAKAFLRSIGEDVWVIGGPGLFAGTLGLANELYLTQLADDFKCTKLFPEFKDEFALKSESEPITENGITYSFQVWARK